MSHKKVIGLHGFKIKFYINALMFCLFYFSYTYGWCEKPLISTPLSQGGGLISRNFKRYCKRQFCWHLTFACA